MSDIDKLNRSFNDLTNYLQFVKSIGFKGFDCSEDVLKTLKSLDIVNLNYVAESVDNSCGDCSLKGEKFDGFGDKRSNIMFISESPDDLINKSSESSVLFAKMLNSIGLSVDNVYITYLLKCKLPQHIVPLNTEFQHCLQKVESEIKTILPSLICVLGSNATRVIMKKEGLVSGLRGHFIEYGRSILFPTFHPSYLLKNPENKKEAWSDLKKLKEKLSEL